MGEGGEDVVKVFVEGVVVGVVGEAGVMGGAVGCLTGCWGEDGRVSEILEAGDCCFFLRVVGASFT